MKATSSARAIIVFENLEGTFWDDSALRVLERAGIWKKESVIVVSVSNALRHETLKFQKLLPAHAHTSAAVLGRRGRGHGPRRQKPELGSTNSASEC